MEIADMILINKADGDLKPAATRTCADYAGALRLLRKRPQDPEGFPKAVMVSALEESGLEKVLADIEALVAWRREHGFWDRTRADQARYWFGQDVRNGLLAQLDTPYARRMLELYNTRVAQGEMPPAAAAEAFLAGLKHAPE